MKKLGLNRILLVCILVLMFVVFKVVLGSKFPVGDSVKSTLNYVYFLGFLSLGVTFVIATGGIDFSIGPVMDGWYLTCQFRHLSYPWHP